MRGGDMYSGVGAFGVVSGQHPADPGSVRRAMKAAAGWGVVGEMMGNGWCVGGGAGWHGGC